LGTQRVSSGWVRTRYTRCCWSSATLSATELTETTCFYLREISMLLIIQHSATLWTQRKNADLLIGFETIIEQGCFPSCRNRDTHFLQSIVMSGLGNFNILSRGHRGLIIVTGWPTRRFIPLLQATSHCVLGTSTVDRGNAIPGGGGRVIVADDILLYKTLVCESRESRRLEMCKPSSTRASKHPILVVTYPNMPRIQARGHNHLHSTLSCILLRSHSFQSSAT
jgi:hypothetical protein